MKLKQPITDNVTELLVSIVRFTKARHQILIQNLNAMNLPGFVPKDLAVEEFAALLHEALDEHKQNQRLLLRDGENTKFGPHGSFRAFPVVDRYAKQLLQQSRKKYIELQATKLIENSLNQKFAVELLRHKEGAGYLKARLH
jgi:flagellar basal body rod protein FlgB